MSSIPGSDRSPGEENGNPLHYSCLGKPVDRGAWQATVHGVTKEWDMTERLNNSRMCDPDMLHSEGPQLCDIIPIRAQPSSDHEKLPDKCGWRSILQNNWLVLIKSVKIMKHKDKLRECPRLEVEKETQHLIQCGSWIGLWNKTGALVETWYNLNKVCNVVTGIVTVNFLPVTIAPSLCEMLTLGEAGWRVSGTSVLSLQIFCKHKIVWKLTV